MNELAKNLKQIHTEKKSYRTMQKKYIVWSVILGLIVLGGVAAYLWLKPWIINYQSKTFDVVPQFLYLTGIVPLWHAAGGAFAPCLLSLWLDLRIKKHWNLIALNLGIAAMIPAFVTALQLLLWNPPKSGTSELTLWFPFLFWSTWFSQLFCIILPFFGGGGLFLGINRAKAKPE